MIKAKKTHIDIENITDSREVPFDIHVAVEELLIEKEEQLEIKMQIEEMLNSLTARQCEIIYLRYVQKYDYDQIAELLNISVHGCRKLVSKALHSLRTRYGSALVLLLLATLKC